MARAKKAAPVSPPEDETPATPAVAANPIEAIPFGRLKRAPENVRKTNIAADVESLADDIAAHGVLQSLIGYAGDTSVDKAVVWIVGGGRRLQALELLRERGQIGDDFPVSVLLRDPAEAVELSLSENLARRDMNPADEFVAFAALMKPGALSAADLAKRFGFSERYVNQRLRLSVLADEILDALRAGEMTLEAAMAYAASQDKKLQLQAFKLQKKQWKPHDPASIAQGYSGAQMTTSDPLFKFVGAADYEKQGGGYEDDLFADENARYGGGRKLRDAGIVFAIAQPRAEFQLIRLLSAAQKKHPTTLSILLTPGLRHGKTPKAPKGGKLVNRGWNYNWPSYERLRDRAAELEIPITGIAHIDQNGKLVLSDQFFVPADRLDDVLPKNSSGTQETPDERDARFARERRAARIRGHAAVLAVQAIAAPDPSGRRKFNSMTPDLYRTTQLEGVGEVYGIGQTFYVTPVEIELQMAAAEIAIDKADEAAAAQKEADRLAREAASAAVDDRRAALLALETEPAVVTVDGLDFFRWANGEYWDDQEPEDDADACMAEQSADSLAALIEHADAIGQDWPTIAAWAEFRAAAEAESVE